MLWLSAKAMPENKEVQRKRVDIFFIFESKLKLPHIK